MGRATLAASILLTAAAAAAQPPDEGPLAGALEGLVLDRQLVAVDARGGGQRELPLRLDERVLWTGARGRVGVAFTDQRVLAVAVGSAAWQEVGRQLDEALPDQARTFHAATVAKLIIKTITMSNNGKQSTISSVARPRAGRVG